VKLVLGTLRAGFKPLFISRSATTEHNILFINSFKFEK
jgi:hypothetical protein